MTCIVALRDGDAVVMGADSAGVGGLSIRARRDPKIYRVGSMLIGFTTSFRMGQLLGYSLILPEYHEDISVERYMATVFVDAVRKCLKDGGFASKNNETEAGGQFLVAYRSRIFEIASDYQIEEDDCEYAAVGCGVDLALGSLHATAAMKITDAHQRIRMAMEAAATFSAGVRGPFHIETLA